MTKRPIDRKRDAGGIMEIGTPDDQSGITAIFPIGDDLYVVKTWKNEPVNASFARMIRGLHK
jgi:hypothetical protein